MQTENPSQHTNRHLWIETLRIVCALGVIAIHVAYPLTLKWGQISTKWWLIAETYNAFGRFAVPVFFMLSGYLLLGRPLGPVEFIWKRAGKILAPLVIWSAIYVFWGEFSGERNFPAFGVVLSFLSGPTADHLWFLYTLVGLYLAAPVLFPLTSADNQKILDYFLALWFLFVPLKNFIEVIFSFPIGFDFPLAGAYLGYFILGYRLGNLGIHKKRWGVLLTIFLMSTGQIIGGNYWRGLSFGRLDGFFDNYLGIVILFQASSLFLLFSTLDEPLNRLPGWQKWLIEKIGAASFGIYLAHLLFIELFRRGYLGFKLSAVTHHPFYGIPSTVLAVFTISLALTLLLKAIPGIKRAVP